LIRVSRLGGCVLAAATVSLAVALPAAAASNNIIVTYAGNGTKGFSGDGGQATAAKLGTPADVLLDNSANVFIADTANNRVRKVAANGVITTVAGNGTAGFGGDGGAATAAKLSKPAGLAMDSDGNLYIADTGNDKVRKVATNGTITTILGASGTSPQLSGPTGLAVDSSKNLYVADTGHSVIVKRTQSGSTSTFAGQSGKACKSPGNGGSATSASLCRPVGVAVSGAVLLIADTGNNQVRKVSGGTISAFAGTGTSGYSGDGGQATSAKLKAPTGVTYDRLGNVDVVDAGNNRVRQITTSGVITTLIGNGGNGYSGDNGPCEQAMIQTTGGVTADADNVFIADTANSRVRRCHKDGPPPALPESGFAQNVLLASSAAAVLGLGVVVLRRRGRRGPGSAVAA
jgi:trimeric autotransporter adhesin